jgi:hypothetical protein
MTKERKVAILFAATIRAARKLIEMEPDKPDMAKGCIVGRAIDRPSRPEPATASAASFRPIRGSSRR